MTIIAVSLVSLYLCWRYGWKKKHPATIVDEGKPVEYAVLVQYRFANALEAMRFAEQLTIDQPPHAERWTVGEIREDGAFHGLKISKSFEPDKG